MVLHNLRRAQSHFFFDIAFAPHEIKTFRINRANWTLREVDLLEQ